MSTTLSRSVRILMLFVALSGASSAPVDAQSASITGLVMDTSGAAVAGTAVTLTGNDVHRVSLTDTTGAYRFASLAQGIYQLVAEFPGFVPARRTDIVVGASAAVMVPAISLAIAGFGEATVVTASRTESSVVDAPATVTVISAATIEMTAGNTFGDLLRSVPGLNVIQTSARDTNLTSRQATSTVATSQLALLDGRSVYLDFIGLVLWDMLPTNVDDIKQIEVVRGPASAVWGANAQSGVVNIITKSPREVPNATRVTLSAGWFDRSAGSTAGRGAGSLYGASVSTSRVVNDRWAYRISAGQKHQDALPRPTGRIPRITDPRDPLATIGGASYPGDGNGAFGTAFRNVGTSQPKFDVRIDQDLGRSRVTYAGGVAGTAGTIHTGVGPFDIQPGSLMGYASVNYLRDGLKVSSFLNVLDAKAPNLLLPDARTGAPLRLDFTTRTLDVDVSDRRVVASRHWLNYGGNVRLNQFDVTLAPGAGDRHEGGAYLQDEVFAGPWRLVLGARVDKLGSIDTPVLSPRLAAIFKPSSAQSVRVSFNRAARSPSIINNLLDVALITPVDLRALGLSATFPLVVRGVGSDLPIGSTSRPALRHESMTAYELTYTGTFGARTTAVASFYVNDQHDSINFVSLPNNVDPYTAAAPPPGWSLPGAVLGALAQAGVYLPRTAFTYLNLGPLRQKGLELSLDGRLSRTLTAFANYSWQDKPQVLDDANRYPAAELAWAPAHRVNVGASYSGTRYLASTDVHYTDRAFWSDVLTPAYHGFSAPYTLVNATGGVKWRSQSVTALVKVNDLLNRTVQQHVFGDLMRRSVTGELRFVF